MASEDFCLKWNDHHMVFFSLAEELHQQGVLTDVTLATSTRTFPAHRLVLSICSSFFSNLFAKPEFAQQQQTPSSHGGHYVYLKDVAPHHLEMLLSYMYRGEINCQEAELLGLIATARGLGVKGLSDVEEESGRRLPSPLKKGRGSSKRKREDVKEVVEAGEVETRIKLEEDAAEQDGVEPQVVEPRIEGMMLEQAGEESWFENMGYQGEVEDGQPPGGEDSRAPGGEGSGLGGETLDCPQCPKSFASSWHLKRHVLTHSKMKKCRCEYCGKLFSRNDNLKSHQKSVHGFLFAPGSSEVQPEGNGDEHDGTAALEEEALARQERPHKDQMQQETVQ